MGKRYGVLLSLLFSITRWREKSICWTTVFVSPTKKIISKLRSLRPFSQRQSSAIKGQSYIVASIVLLLLFGCPTTVFKTIATIVVYSIKAQVFGWTISHIIEEVDKVIPSWVFDLYSASAIISIGLIVLVIAPLDHALPSVIYPSARHIVEQTATTFRSATSKMMSSRDFSFPAVALAKPKNVSIFGVGNESNHRQLSESF